MTESDLKHFVETVIAMRKLQKSYFKTKDRQELIRAKGLEASVDMQASRLQRDLESASDSNESSG